MNLGIISFAHFTCEWAIINIYRLFFIPIENDLLYLKGSIPGSKNTEVLVKKAIKNVQKLTISEKIEIAEKAKKTPDKNKK